MPIFDPCKKFRFRSFTLYIEARRFAAALKREAREAFPKSERYGLTPQLRRALDSVVLNIAEGCERGSDKDFAHFLAIANASLNEVVACLDIASDEGYLGSGSHSTWLEPAARLSNQISAFQRHLRQGS